MNAELALAASLQDLAHRIDRRLRSADAGGAIPPAQLSALAVLVAQGALTLGDLAAIEQVTPPSMSRTVDELERHGLVRRARDKRDRRVVYAVATREGSRLLAEARHDRLRPVARALTGLDEDDHELLTRALALLDEHLERPGD